MQKLSLFLLLIFSMAASATAQNPLTLIELTQEEIVAVSGSAQTEIGV